MHDLSEDGKVEVMAQATYQGLIAALQAMPPQQMVDVPLLLRALCADYTDPRAVKAKQIIGRRLGEDIGSQLMRGDCNPWSAEQALSRAECAFPLFQAKVG